MSESKAPDEARDQNGAVDAVPNSAEEALRPATAAPPEDPLERAQAEAARFKDQLLRLAADFDNFKKRSRRELTDMAKVSREDVLRALLPVFDGLERAKAHATEATSVAALTEGIQMVMREFTDTLGKLGVERIPSVGTAFDPAVHEAVQHLETAEHAPGTVAMELLAVAKPPPS
jgi:molecular chaperone GrpE